MSRRSARHEKVEPCEMILHSPRIALTISIAGALDVTLPATTHPLHSKVYLLSVTPITPTGENYHCRLFWEAENSVRHYALMLYLRR